MKKQVYNPFLPLDVCIPDGEPHIFGKRVYIFGSHEEEGGDKFCSLDYEFFSASLDDLTNWTSRGINYSAKQDPSYSEKYKYMYAPDVVQGKDGKFYLYYAMSGADAFTGPIHVAVSDEPDGKYQYYGEVRNPDGSTYTRKITFDPAVINDNGVIRLYYGWSLAVNPKQLPANLQTLEFQQTMRSVQQMLFGKTMEELRNEQDGIMGAYEVELAEDMLTVQTEPKRIVAGQFDSFGTEYEGHAFFEGSSIRKIGKRYYFIYSSEKQHELCYAVSEFPDKDFRYGGVIISNGDVGLAGRKEEKRLAATGNNHGSIVKIQNQWYVFYHRHTHKTTFSRQACAEKIIIHEDGSIFQTEITSCGLNDGPLVAEGTYPAVICCNLTKDEIPHLEANKDGGDIPYITHGNGEHYITNISDKTVIGYKYFIFSGETKVTLVTRGDPGIVKVYTDITNGNEVKKELRDNVHWRKVELNIKAYGKKPLYMEYEGAGKRDLLEIIFG